MENLISCVDKVRFDDVEGCRKILVKGWAFARNDEPLIFNPLLNGCPVSFQLRMGRRHDVYERFKDLVKDSDLGFTIIITVDPGLPIHSFSLDLNGKKIVNYPKKKIGKLTNRNYIIYEYDPHCALSQDGSTWVSGTAYSLNGEGVAVSVEDSDGRPVKAEIQCINREELVASGEIRKENVKSGFYITYPGGYKEKNVLVLKTSKEEKKLPIYSQGNTVRDLAGIVWHNANPIRAINAVNYLHEHGLSGLRKKAILEARRFSSQLKKGENFHDIEYNEWFHNQEPDEAELEKQKETIFEYTPKISIIVAAFNTPIPYLADMIGSVENQTYSNWELCISDGSTNDQVQKYVRDNYKNDQRIKYVKLDKNYGIAGNMNEAMKLADGDYISLFDHDDLLTPDCLYEVVSSLQEYKYDVIYTDEDKLNDMTKLYMDPHFKPDFAVDQLRSHNYITHFLTVNSNLVRQIGMLRSEFDGSQDHDFILRATEKANAVHHIPKILYHWRMHPSSTAMDPESKMYCYISGKKAVQEQLNRLGIKGHTELVPGMYGMYHVFYNTSSNPLVSIIIPNKDHASDLETCIDSVMEKSTYRSLEFIVVENNSEEPSTFKAYEELQKKYPNVKVITWKDEFNYPRINNFGRQHAQGELLLFLNNDTELIEPDSIREMVGLALQPDIGAVGAKLLYKDHTIQHAGVVLGYKGYATHAFLGLPDKDPGHMQRPQIVSNYSAVTAACMMVKTADFDQVGGFDSQFVVAVNDVDLCLKLLKLGRRNVYTPFSKWYHYESKTRGLDYSGANNERFLKEVELFQKKWPDAWQKPDPFHNPNFDLDRGPFTFYQ